MATPEKMYMIGKTHSMAFCIIWLWRFTEAGAVLRRIE